MNPQCPSCQAERTMLDNGTEFYRCGSKYNQGKLVHACYKPITKQEFAQQWPQPAKDAIPPATIQAVPE